MTTDTTAVRAAKPDQSAVPVGDWRVDPVRSHASFTARVAGRSVRGRLPLSGEAIVTASVEDSAAHLTAMRRRGSPGDQLPVADAGLRPDRVEGIGHLQVKGTDHPIVCELDVDLRHPKPGEAG